MAQDSEDIEQFLDFHPCNTPRGMDRYKLEELTPYQQECLNIEKIVTIKETQKYLNEHPEIRTIVSMIIRNVVMQRPSHNVPQFIVDYVLNNWDAIEKKVATVRKPKDLDSETSSDEAIGLQKAEKHVHIKEEEVELLTPIFGSTVDMCREIIDEILDKVETTLDEKEKKARAARRFSFGEDFDFSAPMPTDLSLQYFFNPNK